MISSLVASTRRGSNYVSGDVPSQSNGAIASDRDKPGILNPEPIIGEEAEQLLDLEGLLKIAQLIQEIKKDGRLNGEGEEDVKHQHA